MNESQSDANELFSKFADAVAEGDTEFFKRISDEIPEEMWLPIWIRIATKMLKVIVVQRYGIADKLNELNESKEEIDESLESLKPINSILSNLEYVSDKIESKSDMST